MSIAVYLKEQVGRHPSMQPQDVVKLLYQAAFGVEHLLKDINAAERYLEAEYAAIEPDESPLYETIHDKVCRVNLAAWKKRQLPTDLLFQMFLLTAERPFEYGGKVFEKGLKEAERLVREGTFGFDEQAWKEFIADYPVDNPVAVHHSESYRRAERPAYRLISSYFIPMLSIFDENKA